MPTKPPPLPRKAPRQARSQATVGAILDATARVLVERGYAATNTNLVAERAGVSVGSLYQYFPNKDALIRALHERHMQQMYEVIGRSLCVGAGLPMEQALTLAIEGLVESHRIDAGLHRVLETQVTALQLADAHERFEADLNEQLCALLRKFQAELRVENLRLAAYVLMHAVHGLVHAVVHQRPGGVSLKQATREIVRLTRAYLTAPLDAPA
ncbi:TetR/AcrR family transcriptional regulator [Aquabacterium sp.]|uniref:TetR/AcrR family transcriptional regulator n=1 Tax=Aquabacterium sp. TaxID=1872578 RepID=UPI00378367C1